MFINASSVANGPKTTSGQKITTPLEDIVSLLYRQRGAIIRKGQHSLSANVIFNGRSLELEAARFRGGVMVARRCGSVVAFDWFQKKFADFAAKRKEDTEIDMRPSA